MQKGNFQPIPPPRNAADHDKPQREGGRRGIFCRTFFQSAERFRKGLFGAVGAQIPPCGQNDNVKKSETSLPENKPGGSKTLAVDCNNGDVEVEIANA